MESPPKNPDALLAAAVGRYDVRKNGRSLGRTFTLLANAETFARRVNGEVVPIN